MILLQLMLVFVASVFDAIAEATLSTSLYRNAPPYFRALNRTWRRMYREEYLPERRIPKIYLGDSALQFLYNVSALAKIFRLVALMTLALLGVEHLVLFLVPFVLLAGNLLVKYMVRAFNTDTPYTYLAFHMKRFLLGYTILALPAIAIAATFVSLGFYILDFLNGKTLWLVIHILAGTYSIVYMLVFMLRKIENIWKSKSSPTSAS